MSDISCTAASSRELPPLKHDTMKPPSGAPPQPIASFFITQAADSMLGLLLITLVRTRWPNAEFRVVPQADDAADVQIGNLATGASLRVYSGELSRRTIAAHLAEPNCSLLTYDASAEELMAGLSCLEGGPTYISSKIVEFIAGKSTRESETLTPRERQVVALVVEGYTNNEIAAELYVSANTVRTHLQSVSSRLGVSSRGRLAARVRELGLV